MASRILAGGLLALACLALAGARSLQEFVDSDTSIKYHWAVLVAGSKGWGNYRHQADICHAYHVLRAGGLDESRIIVMMSDDIADNPNNPFPGKIYNSPHGKEVYADVPKDYTGKDVTAHNFLSVLAGLNMKGVGTGKTVKSTRDDRVFVYYADHGAPGVVGMPEGPFLYADEFNAVIKSLATGRHFKEMVVYVEACESGSVFQGLLDSKLPVFATTAANAYESSWGTYCPGQNPGPKPGLNTCMGDLYSVSWLEDSEVSDLNRETLQEQFKAVRKRTSHNFTYQQGSHVLEFGMPRISKEPAGDYIGMEHHGHKAVKSGVNINVNAAYEDGKDNAFIAGYSTADKKARTHDCLAEAQETCTKAGDACGGVTYEPGNGKYTTRRAHSYAKSTAGEVSWLKKKGANGAAEPPSSPWPTLVKIVSNMLVGDAAPDAAAEEELVSQWEALPAREAELVPLIQDYMHAAEGTPEKHAALVALNEAVAARAAADGAMRGAIAALLSDESSASDDESSNAIPPRRPRDAMLAFASRAGLEVGDAANGGADAAMAAVVEAFALEPMNTTDEDAVVQDWDCLRAMVAVWEDECGPMDGYSMKHTRGMANLCNAGVAAAAFGDAMDCRE